MKAYDVKFTINSGDNQGKEYPFTLATANGRKAWQRVRVYEVPPSMIKYKITMSIIASHIGITGAGAIHRAKVGNVLENLEDIANETSDVTLIGLDNEEYSVVVDKNGIQEDVVVDEKKSSPEYQVGLVCWALHT